MTDSRLEFLKNLKIKVHKICKERGLSDVVRDTCISQACLESNYGQSNIMRNNHAYFGIKATKAWINSAKYGGKVYNSKTKECYDGKSLTNITACFRAYSNDEDCINDYLDLLSTPRYKKCLKAETVKECITIIKESGYATSPTYIANVMAVFRSMVSVVVVDERKEEPKLNIVDIRRKAYDVIAGRYGNGEERKKALGSEYEIVQKEVNKILRGN